MTTQQHAAARTDAALWSFLEDDLLGLMLAPPRVPAFAAETVRP